MVLHDTCRFVGFSPKAAPHLQLGVDIEPASNSAALNPSNAPAEFRPVASVQALSQGEDNGQAIREPG